MDQDAAQVNDSVYELDTQVIQPVTHDQIPDQAQANVRMIMQNKSFSCQSKKTLIQNI